jgi:hypothetical protein
MLKFLPTLTVPSFAYSLTLKMEVICSSKTVGSLEGVNSNIFLYVRFEDFTAATMKNGIIWDVTLCGSCKNQHFGGT